MDLQLQGKLAFISGSTQGIGLSVAKQLLEEGAHVIINGRDAKKVDLVREELLKQFPDAIIMAMPADFSNEADVNKLLDQLPAVDILINNVGIFGIADFYEITDVEWYRYLEINLMSGMRLSKKLLPEMIKQNWGRIIFISSESGVNVPEDMIHYGVTKAAMNALSNGLSKLTRGTAVTVNSILGGPTYSDGVKNAVRALGQQHGTNAETLKSMIIQQSNPHILLQRFIEPSEIANLVAYLSSPLSVATNGASLRADSGVLKV